MDYEELIKAIDEAKDNSYGSDVTGNLAQKRAKALEYYLGLNTKPAPEGRSQVVDRSVYETIHVLMPSLVKIFAGSSDEVCKAVPIGPDDEEAADQTTAVLRHYVTEKNNWEQIVTDWIHDAMLMPNSYCMAWWEDNDNKIREKYEDQSEEELTAILQDPDVEVVEHEQEIDDEATALQEQQWLMMVQQSQMTGQPIPPKPEPVYEHTVVIERKEKEEGIRIKTLAPEHCRVSIDTPDWTLNECPYFEYREQKTIADIRAMGFDIAEDINDDESAFFPSVEDNVRDRYAEQQIYETGKGPMRTVWIRMIWIRTALGKAKKSSLYYVIAVGRTVLYAEPCSSIPVASMTTEPLPHRHLGMSVAETVMDLQDIKQAIKRGALDNLYLANNGRHVISSKVNVEDFLDARPGGVVRMTDESLPGEGHVMPLVHPFSFDTIVGSLEYFDQDRQNRSGASRYFSGTDAGAINKTMGGTIALQNMASMRVEHRARMMAPGIEALFRVVWELISKHASKPLVLKLRGKWTLVDPQAWRTKRDIKISVGVGAGNKESMMAQLQQVLMSQMQVGMPLGLVQRENIHKTNVEILKLAGFANPEAFWPNPATTKPPQQPPPPEVLKIQAEKEMKQVEMQADAQKFQADAMMKREERQFHAQEAEKQRLFDLEKAKMSEATKLAIAEMNKETTLETTDKTQQFQAGMKQVDMQREDMQKQSEEQKVQEKDDGMRELLVNLQSAIESLSRPKQVIRGPDGKIVGVQ